MFKVSDPLTTPPPVFSTELQRQVYETFARLEIPFERVDTDPGLTMEDCQQIDEKIGVRIVKTLFLCNRQQTEFYLYVTTDDKPFVTREFCGALGIPRVSFASAEWLWSLTGVEVGATTMLSAILPPSGFTWLWTAVSPKVSGMPAPMVRLPASSNSGPATSSKNTWPAAPSSLSDSGYC